MASTAPRTRLSREDRMEQTLSIASRLFAERGYAAVTMDEVAAEVGVTKPLLYNYFGNKEGLCAACVERAGDALLAAIGTAVAETADPAGAMRAGGQAFFDFVDGERAAWAVIFDESVPRDSRVAERVAAYRGRILALVTASILGQAPPDIREAAATEVEALSEAIFGAAEALAHWWLRTEAVSAAEAAELLIATIEPGLQQRWTPVARRSAQNKTNSEGGGR